jgi:transposase
MFIRRTRKKDPKTKKEYALYQLVEAFRTERGPRQRILLSLGTDIGIESKEDLKLLANRIEEILKGINTFFSCPEKIESLAQQYASSLLNRISKNKTVTKKEEKEEDFHRLDVNSIEQQKPRSVGVEYLLLHFAKLLKIPQKLEHLGFSSKEVALSLASIIARATFPASERATFNWLLHHSGLDELIDFDFQKSSLNHLYKISDKLLKHKEELEKHLENSQRRLHGFKSTIVLYDLTNTYIEGKAKNNNFDCPLITLGLLVNEHGFILRSSILPGNVAEPKTLEEAIEAMGLSEELFKPTIVMDAGIASEDNLKWLRNQNYTYVVSPRQNAPSMELEDTLVPIGDFGKTGIKVAFIKNKEKEEKWLYCESQAKTIKASQMTDLFCQRFETDLQGITTSLLKPRGHKKYTKVLQRVGRLKEKHKRISSCYEIEIEVSEDGENAIAIRWHKKSAKLKNKMNGHYFLRTNLIDLPPTELWMIYNSIRRVEDTFRFMKSSLGIRPIFHRKEKRVDGHLWITILAYHLIQSCLYELKESNISCNWETVRQNMSKRIRVTVQAKTEKGQMLYHRSTTKPEEQQKKIYRALGINPQILKAVKTFV